MTPELLFSIASPLAAAGWVLLAVAPKRRWAALGAGFLIPLLLAAVYFLLIAARIRGAQGGFGSLAAVASLFSDPWLLLAGWVHYLAFDLFIGGWQLRDSQRRGVPHLAMLPILLLTFMFGPIGLLAYFGVRSIPRFRTPA